MKRFQRFSSFLNGRVWWNVADQLRIDIGEKLTHAGSMAFAIITRAERLDDAPIITSIVRRAYADVSYSDHREHIMVERLRETDAYVPELSLLAEIEGEAVGHVLLTKASIRTDRVVVTALALAPLSVLPEFQSRGVGKHLVRSAHERASALGFEAVLLVGIPDYYPQFGYERLSHYPIALPFEAPDENCMILKLRPDALQGVAGSVLYAKGRLDH